MSIAKITLIGMYQWMNDQNDPLFKNLTVPAGMDKDKLINTILYIGAEFGVVYADPYFMQSMIGVWSERHKHTLTRWIRALEIDYDPLENYDRREEWSDVGTRSKAGSTSRLGSEINGFTRSDAEVESSKHDNTGSSSDVRTSSLSEESTTGNSTSQTTAGNKTGDQSDEHKVSAYDSGTYQAKDKTDTDTADAEVTASQSNSRGTTDGSNNINSVEHHQTSDGQTSANNRFANESGTENKIRNESGSDTEAESHGAAHTGRTHGNIGVTTSQQMLEAELDVARFNVYDEAADLFVSEFCIYVY